MANNIEISDLIQYNITICPDDWFVQEIYCQFHRFYYIYSGEAVYESMFEKFFLKKNTMYFLPIFKRYKITHNPDSPLNCLWFHINLDRIPINETINIPVIENSAEFYTIKLLESLVREGVNNLSIKTALNVILQLIQNKEQLVFGVDSRLDEILKYIHENFQLKLSNKTLANLLNIDQRYFIRLFKKSYGRTPQEYVSCYKAFRAANLLMKGFKVNKVAEIIGFDDPKAFSRFFKLHKGISPSKYKNSYYLQP